LNKKQKLSKIYFIPNAFSDHFNNSIKEILSVEKHYLRVSRLDKVSAKVLSN